MKHYSFLNLLLVISYNLCFTQTEIVTILDKETHKLIPFVTVSFGENDGIYSDIEGKFSLELIVNDTIILSSIGYKTQTVLKNSIQTNTIYLQPTNVLLEEVIVSNKKKKFKLIKSKPINDKDFLNSYKNPIGSEIACLIPNNYGDKDVQIKSILIPSYNKTMTKEMNKQVLKRHTFKTIYKITFLQNENGIPGDEIKTDFITLIFDEKTDTSKLNIEIQQIYLPKNGCFISLLNLGPADENGNLIPTSPFYEKQTSKGLMRFSKPIKPYFPINFDKNEIQTFVRHMFNEDKDWKPFYFRKNRTSEFHNLSLGYELKVFE